MSLDAILQNLDSQFGSSTIADPNLDQGQRDAGPGGNETGEETTLKKSGQCDELRYADDLAAALPPIKTTGPEWHVYKQGVWKFTGREIFLPEAQGILPPRSRTAKNAKALLDHLEGRFQITPESLRGFHMFDAEGAVLVNVANGVLRVTPSEITLLRHAPEHLFTNQLAAGFQLTSKPTLFERVLTEALPDAGDQGLLQLSCGNLLFPDCRHEAALACYGEAGSGKSTVADGIGAAVGEDLIGRLSMKQICDHRSYHLPTLRYAAANLATELDAIDVDDSANFKAIVSGEAIEVRPIYGRPFKMKTTAKLWFLANSLPRFKNGTGGELRRMRFIHFCHPPKAHDVTLKAKVRAERDAVLNFMLAGLQHLMAAHGIPLGGAESTQVHDRFGVSNDPVGTFVGRYCSLSTGASVTKEAIRTAFTNFQETYALTLPDNSFFRRLYERFPQLVERQCRLGGGRVRVVAGIALRKCEGAS